MKRKLVSGRVFRSLVETGQASDQVLVRAGLVGHVCRNVGEGEARSFEFVLSTSAVDRYGDTVDVNGWDLAAFRENPVVLWAHDHDLLPVGRAADVRVEGEALRAAAHFPTAELSSFGASVFEMIRSGFLNAVSVGFIPRAWRFVDQPDRPFGVDFLEQELIEFSVVPVPAHPGALVDDALAELPGGLVDDVRELPGDLPGEPDAETDRAAAAAAAAAAAEFLADARRWAAVEGLRGGRRA